VTEPLSTTSSTNPPADAAMPERHPDAPRPGEAISRHYRLCFGCGEDHPSGLHMRVTAGEGLEITAQFTVTEHHQGAPGLAHGGVLTVAVDEALGSLNWLIREPAVTGRLETDFRRPVPVGQTLFINGRITGKAGRKVYVQGEGRLGSPDGPLAVTAAALFITVGLEHFRAHGRPEDVAAAVADDTSRHFQRNFEVNP
jgi:acyl-coenzyme A thioesterase PaaI-like protein